MCSSRSQKKMANHRYGTIEGNDKNFLNDEENNVLSISDAIERLGHGGLQQKMLVIFGFCYGSDAIEILLLSYLSIVLQTEWGLSNTERASITSSVFAGAILGSVVLGTLGDRIGRRPIGLASGFLISVFGVLTATTSTFPWLLAARSFVGVGIGGLMAPYDIFAEFSPTKQRGSDLLYLQFFWTAGATYVTICAYFALGLGHNNWKLLVVLCSIPCWIGFIGTWFWIPESPHWLCATGKPERALEVLRSCASQNGKDPDEIFPESIRLTMDSTPTMSLSQSCGWICDGKWRRLFLLLAVPWVGFGVLYYGTILVTTEIFSHQHGGNVHFNFVDIGVATSSELVGICMLLYTVDRWGRVKSNSFTFLFSGLCIAALCFGTSTFHISVIAQLLLAYGARLFSMAASCVTWLCTPEILTTELRMTGHGFVNAASRIAAAITPFVVQRGTPRPEIALELLAVSVFVALISLLLPETAGKALDSV